MSLKDRIIRLIEADGPMPISMFMQMALHDPSEGYYATRSGLGQDFTTAPETSQVFGELLGAWVVHEWDVLGRPQPFHLVELGPGRGTLMVDALRAMSSSETGRACLGALQLILVEASPALRKVQAERLQHASPVFVDDLQDVPEGQMLLLANEFLDCLPARQFERDTDGTDWFEVRIGSENGELTYGRVRADLDWLLKQTVGALDHQPGLRTLCEILSHRKHPFRALFVDYGPMDQPPAGSLRAYKDGAQVDPLDQPGAQDLTVDVDFGALKTEAETAGLEILGPLPQGQFLLALGAEARMQSLVRANPNDARSIFEATKRLVDPSEMGNRFKAICLSSSGLPRTAGF